MSYTKPNLKSKHYDNLFNSLPSLEGKTIAITGTTSGTGYVAANACGKLGAKVLLLNRQSERSVKSYESLKANTPNGDFIRIECDLQNFNSVKESTKNIEESSREGLDVLCNNAGGNIAIGDGICSSSTAGIGQKATANPSMIIGIAQEAVTFSGSETKLVPVQYGLQQFIPWS